MNTDLNADTILKSSFIRALTTWKCNTLINWKLGATTLIEKTAFDSVNVITFGGKEDLPSGTLAICYSYWGQCASSDWVLEEADVVINPNANWEYGPELPSIQKYDFESVILHELGHGHQLAHVIDETDIMNYSIKNGEAKRTLNTNNITAATDVLNRSTAQNYCGYSIYKLLAASSCSDIYIGNADSDFLIFPNPSNGYFNIAIPDKKQNLTISVYNSLGNLLTTISTFQSSDYLSLDLSEYAGGIYFLRIDNGKQITIRKVIFSK